MFGTKSPTASYKKLPPKKQPPDTRPKNWSYIAKKMSEGLVLDTTGIDFPLDVNPLVIVPDKHVSIEYIVDTNNPGIAYTQKGKDKGYHIVVNLLRAQQMHKACWLSNTNVTLRDIVTGMVLHEVGHVRYTPLETPRVEEVFKNPLHKYIYNVIEDARIEYQMTQEFPAYSQYISVMLSGLRLAFRATKGNQKATPNPIAVTKGQQDVERYTRALFDFIRYNVISKDSKNYLLMNFIVAYALSGMRGNADNCLDCTQIIYEYIERRTSASSQPFAAEQDAEQFPVTEGDMEQMAAEGGEAVQAKTENLMRSIENIKEAAKGTKGQSVIEAAKDGTAFFNATVAEHAEGIAVIRNIFKKIMNKVTMVNAFDGDMNFIKQQEAYVGSLVGEDGKYYKAHRLDSNSIDVVIVRDVSGSTSGFETEYAKAIIVLLAALEGITGVRTAEIDFSDDVKLHKNFNDPLRKSFIEPVSMGGTELLRALAVVKDLSYKGLKRICYIITDGGWSDAQACSVMMHLITRTSGMMFKVLRVENTNIIKYHSDYTILNVQHLAEFVLQQILKEVKR